MKHAAAVRRMEVEGSGGQFRLMDAGRVGEQLSQVETDWDSSRREQVCGRPVRRCVDVLSAGLWTQLQTWVRVGNLFSGVCFPQMWMLVALWRSSGPGPSPAWPQSVSGPRSPFVMDINTVAEPDPFEMSGFLSGCRIPWPP